MYTEKLQCERDSISWDHFVLFIHEFLTILGAQEGDGGEAQVPVAGAWQSTNRKQERQSQKGSVNFVTA
jgi:hypothetical protein